MRRPVSIPSDAADELALSIAAAAEPLVKLAQDLLTSYQRFASNADGCIDSDLENRAKALGLDTKAWL